MPRYALDKLASYAIFTPDPVSAAAYGLAVNPEEAHCRDRKH
jgi:hypothetical protein